MTLFPSHLVSAADAPVATATKEFTLLAGYGTTHPGFGETRTVVQTIDLIGRFGWFLSDEWGEGWYRGRHELLVELPAHVVVDPNLAIMTGGYLLGSWKFTGSSTWFPYLFAGGGVIYTNLDLPTMGSSLNFSYQGGIGVQYRLRDDLYLTGEYRYHHVSNAGTASPNEPLNSSLFLVGLSRFY